MLSKLGIGLALGGLAVQPCVASALHHKTRCSSLQVTPPEGSTLINATATERYNVTYDGPTYNGPAGSVDICDIEVFLTHGDAGDKVRFAIYLPLKGWNGRWQGTGGGGFGAGEFDFETVSAVTSGFAAGSTDAGVGLDGNTDVWYNSTQLVENFVHLSFHEMTVLGKDLAEKFYGRKPSYSYWFGCSTGGRQGMSEAQRYPEDYDGIFAGSPAINWDKLVIADYWPLTAQSQGGKPASACTLTALQNASIDACDMLDGARDGLISNPLKCKFDAKSMIGKTFDCNDDANATTTTITKHDAVAWNKIRNGLQDEKGNSLWYGLQPGAEYVTQAVQPGFLISIQWISDFLLRSPGLDVSHVKQHELVKLFHQSVDEFGDFWGTADADLSAFRARGGKILTWHGWADDLISPLGTLDYWQRVVEKSGGVDATDDFYRVFMAPGLGHCGGGRGPSIPGDSVAPLVEWVEKGKAPDTLLFSGNGQSRNICKFPQELKYSGCGKISEASSWKCV